MCAVQEDLAQYCQSDFLTTQKVTKWLMNGVMRSFLSMLISKAAIFNSDCFSDDIVGRELGKFDFRGIRQRAISPKNCKHWRLQPGCCSVGCFIRT